MLPAGPVAADCRRNHQQNLQVSLLTSQGQAFGEPTAVRRPPMLLIAQGKTPCLMCFGKGETRYQPALGEAKGLRIPTSESNQLQKVN